jgi:beta-xylosidase
MTWSRSRSASIRRRRSSALLAAFLLAPLGAAQVSKVWVADNGDGTYRNPVLHADYSDPDVVGVGDDFYIVASSFDQVPGLPVLESKDLVNWRLIGHVFAGQPPADVYGTMQHGNGAWAPSIRYHNGEFYIYYPDPDFGLYLSKARNPAGPWSAPLLIKGVKGWIDPCPLWDEDGRAYLVHALAASRASAKSILVVHRMSPDGTTLLDDGAIVYDGHAQDPGIEGPKFYKRNGYYYIFAPAGGVAPGWQLALRSRSVWGPYERRVVLAQGATPVNGPHQGGWVETPRGESWFLHFQDKGAYGRVVHLQPMRWVNDWPVIGVNGEPVLTYNKPSVAGTWPMATPPDSDEFNSPDLGLQWQWAANPKPNWAFPSSALGCLRLFAVPPPPGARNLWDVPSLLTQKFPAPEFTVTTKVTFSPSSNQDRAGLIVLGQDYAYIAVRKKAEGFEVYQATATDAAGGAAEKESAPLPLKEKTVYLRVKVSAGAVCNFSYSTDGSAFTPVADAFQAKPGRWIGAKVGIFAAEAVPAHESGYADFDWFRVE